MDDLVGKIRSKEEVDTYNWKYKQLKSVLDFYIEEKYCKIYKNELMQWEELNSAVYYVEQTKEKMLKAKILSTPGMKDYLVVHSVFKTNDFKSTDWFIKEMLQILVITDEDVLRLHKLQYVPPELLNKLSMFDPEPIGLRVDNVRVEYTHGFKNSIDLIETDWEEIKANTVNVQEVLSKYKPIDAGTRSVIDNSFYDGIPF